ncbi:MAG: M48 family metallopeptidase [Mameliella sp.]|nr:M48 family metallopeptidase [Phaeodactylibacter sp.]
MKKIQSLLFVVAVLATATQCTTVPITGRSQLSLIPNSQVLPMSFDQFTEVKNSNKIVTTGSDAAMLRRCGSKIQRAVEQYLREQNLGNHLDGFEWEYILIDDNTVNAWAMPGGKVAFYTGILPVTKDETGMAVVMAHEIAHIVANHGRERISQTLAAQTGLSLAAIAAGQGGASLTGDMIMQAAGLATNLGVLKFSRTHEKEADRLGLYFMALAGYNPQEALSFWDRMSSSSNGQAPPEFLSTHPSYDTRKNELKKNMPRAMEYYKRSK